MKDHIRTALEAVGSAAVCLCIATYTVAILSPLSAAERKLHDEDHYNAHWCAARHGLDVDTLRARRGEIYEVRIPGGRVDCVWGGYAIEADWAYKHDEGFGQASRYAQVLGLRPGLLLIVTGPGHCDKLSRARTAARGEWTQVGDTLYQTRIWVTGGYECAGGEG